jgi:hypothetical protein
MDEKDLRAVAFKLDIPDSANAYPAVLVHKISQLSA